MTCYLHGNCTASKIIALIDPFHQINFTSLTLKFHSFCSKENLSVSLCPQSFNDNLMSCKKVSLKKIILILISDL